MSKLNKNTEYTFLPKNTKIIDNTLHFNNNKVNPIFYGASAIKWNIFLTFHYNLRSFQRNDDTDKGFEKRWNLFEGLIIEIARSIEGLSNSSIVYLGVGEYKNEQMHTHILINLKDEHLHLVKKVQEGIYERINQKIVYISTSDQYEFDLPPNIQKVRNSSNALSYILKPDWMSMGTEKEIFYTDMNESKPSKNRFLKRCEYFNKFKCQNQMKSNTSKVNNFDENIKDYRYAGTNPFELHGEVQCKDRTLEETIF